MQVFAEQEYTTAGEFNGEILRSWTWCENEFNLGCTC